MAGAAEPEKLRVMPPAEGSVLDDEGSSELPQAETANNRAAPSGAANILASILQGIPENSHPLRRVPAARWVYQRKKRAGCWMWRGNRLVAAPVLDQGWIGAVLNGLVLKVSKPCNTLLFFWNLLLKFKVGFYRRGDLTRASLIAECVVEASDIARAKSAALTQLTPQHPDVVACRYWHAAGYEVPRVRPRW